MKKNEEDVQTLQKILQKYGFTDMNWKKLTWMGNMEQKRAGRRIS